MEWFNEGSVHVARLAEGRPNSPRTGTTAPRVLGIVGEALTGIRGAKTAAKASQKTPVDSAVIAGPEPSIAAVESAAGDSSRWAESPNCGSHPPKSWR